MFENDDFLLANPDDPRAMGAANGLSQYPQSQQANFARAASSAVDMMA